MLHLRLIVPPDRTHRVTHDLLRDPGVTNVSVVAGAGLRPAGDLVTCEVTQEGASEVFERVRRHGLYEDGAVSVSDVVAAPSRNARETDASIPGAPDDAIVWDQVVDRAYSSVRPSISYFLYLTVAVLLAAIAVVTDSSVLVIGAMVVGPEFVTISAMSLGIVLRRGTLFRRGILLLVGGFAVAMVVTLLLSLLADAVGWISRDDVTAERPLTAFIWNPDRWSLVVAVLAGVVGVLSQMTNRGTSLVGVFISVTTVPAAGDLALSTAVGASDQITGAALQLGLNLAGMVVAGALTLLVARGLWVAGRVRRRRLVRRA